MTPQERKNSITKSIFNYVFALRGLYQALKINRDINLTAI